MHICTNIYIIYMIIKTNVDMHSIGQYIAYRIDKI